MADNKASIVPVGKKIRITCTCGFVIKKGITLSRMATEGGKTIVFYATTTCRECGNTVSGRVGKKPAKK